jgi:hypothetical protein
MKKKSGIATRYVAGPGTKTNKKVNGMYLYFWCILGNAKRGAYFFSIKDHVKYSPNSCLQRTCALTLQGSKSAQLIPALFPQRCNQTTKCV